MATRKVAEHGACRCREAPLFENLFSSWVRCLVEQGDGLVHAEPVGKRRVLQLASDEEAQPIPVADRVEAEHAETAGIGPAQTLQALDGGGLPCAVRAEQPEDLTGIDP